MHSYRRLCASALFAFACSCAPAFAAISAGDHLNVHVFNHPELSGVVTVDSHGAIELPVIGHLHVAGLESSQVATSINGRIKSYVPFPSVDVQDFSESQTIFVTGGPGGVLAYAPNETLAAAVAEMAKVTQASDATQTPPNASLDRFDRSRIDLKRVALYRAGRRLGIYDMIQLRSIGDPGPVLFANDTIAFANKPIAVTIAGAANLPGPAYLWPEEPVSDAIAQAGGPSAAAASGHVLISGLDGTSRVVTLGDATFNGPAHPGDTITIPTAPRVTVAGLVEHPGLVTLQNDFTLVSALAAAGGYDKFSDLRRVQIVHAGTRREYNIVKLAHGDLSQNPSLADGDTVFVPEGYKTDWNQVFAGLGGIAGIGVFLTHI
jgi:protein involved in polysaccharide export with SLBB domain